MKGVIKKIAMIGILGSMLGACSTITTIEEIDTYEQPKSYACGAGESIYQQAAEEQMYAIAMNNFAKRINGRVNSKTTLEFKDSSKVTNTFISYTVKDTPITQHIEEERATYVYNGKQYTFVKLRMPKEIFDALVSETKAKRVN